MDIEKLKQIEDLAVNIIKHGEKDKTCCECIIEDAYSILHIATLEIRKFKNIPYKSPFERRHNNK